jgi:sulfate adenylyltransferase subunit 2
MDTAATLAALPSTSAGTTSGRPGQTDAPGTPLVGPFGHPLGHLDLLESLAIFIIREVAAESERPVLLFSGGKDSAVLLHLAAKAFKPQKIPFPVLHVDTGHNFSEVLDYRDAQVEALGARLLVAKVQDTIDQGRVADPGPVASRNRLQTTTLLDAINEHGFDAAFGGARRDEDKARAKERVLSFRDSFGQWDPKRQRPELWQLYQGSVRPGEHLRAFPLSDFTELDVWQYIRREHIELPSIYYAHERDVIERDGMLLAVSEWVSPRGAEVVERATVRYRTVGDATLTGAVRSEASTVDDIIREVAASRISERGATRGDDRFSETAMEDRKREGYF